MSATSSPNSRQGRKTLENLSATLQAAREDCERICDALPDARTAARIGQHNHSGSIGVLKRTPELDEVIHAIVAADKRLTCLN
jgi:hypothetical protein